MKVFGVTMKVSLGDVDFIPPANDNWADINLDAVKQVAGEIHPEQLVSLNNSLSWYMEDGCDCRFVDVSTLIKMWRDAGKPELELHASVTDGWHIWNRFGRF